MTTPLPLLRNPIRAAAEVAGSDGVAGSACCATLAGGALSLSDAEQISRVFKALADPTRVRLLSLVVANSEGEACICDLTEPVGVSQSTVSHHMKQLVEAGLITREQRGKWAYYRVVEGALEGAARMLTSA